MGGVAGHAGLFSTVSDVMKFAETWLDVWHGRSTALPQAHVREFSQRQNLSADSDWALGWDTPTQGASSSGQHFSANSVGHLGHGDCERAVLDRRAQPSAHARSESIRRNSHRRSDRGADPIQKNVRMRRDARNDSGLQYFREATD